MLQVGHVLGVFGKLPMRRRGCMGLVPWRLDCCAKVLEYQMI
jgi:hypothetical protein